jgi:hypothetical protein
LVRRKFKWKDLSCIHIVVLQFREVWEVEGRRLQQLVVRSDGFVSLFPADKGKIRARFSPLQCVISLSLSLSSSPWCSIECSSGWSTLSMTLSRVSFFIRACYFVGCLQDWMLYGGDRSIDLISSSGVCRGVRRF